MKEDKKDQKNPHWQQKPQTPHPSQQPSQPQHPPGKKPQGGCCR